jgi:hypothetical protein
MAALNACRLIQVKAATATATGLIWRPSHADEFQAGHLSHPWPDQGLWHGRCCVHALRGIDLELYEGELVVLLGPSGSGKSTFLNILGGLDAPTAGQAFFKDQELTAFDDRSLTRYRRDHVGFVFQFYNLIPSLTARENVALVTEIAADPMRPEDALALVGLKGRDDPLPGPAVGRRAAARGHCPRHRQAPRGAAVGRAHRRARQPDTGSSCWRRSRRPTANSAPPAWSSPTMP